MAARATKAPPAAGEARVTKGANSKRGRRRSLASASLEDLRSGIDRIDARVLQLLNERARLAIEVGHRKKGGGLSIYVPEREKRIFQRLKALNDGPLRPESVQAIFREVISACLSLEKPLRVSYLGPAGTYSQEAARLQFGSAAELLPQASIDAVFDEVERARSDYGIVPVENSTEGVVAQTLDRFMRSPLTIKAEILLRVNQCLMVRSSRDRIRRIVSHPQSLAQCRDWLAVHHPGVPLDAAASNAAAAEAAAREPGTAAIAGRQAAVQYGLEIVAGNIQDHPNNFTRFLVVSGDGAGSPTGDDKTSLLFSVPHRAGALYRALEVFARAKINLSTIESRPLKGRAWEYVFFVDLVGHAEQPVVARALAALARRALFVKILGSYPAWRWAETEAADGR